MFPLEIWIFFWQLIYTSVDILRIDFVENFSMWSKVDSQGDNLVTVSSKLRLFTITLSYITKTKYQVIKDSSHFLRLFSPAITVFTRFLTILRKQKGLLLFLQQSLQIGNISSFCHIALCWFMDKLENVMLLDPISFWVRNCNCLIRPESFSASPMISVFVWSK